MDDDFATTIDFWTDEELVELWEGVAHEDMENLSPLMQAVADQMSSRCIGL